MANEITLAIKALEDRFTAAVLTGQKLAGCTFEVVQRVGSIEPNMLPYIGMVPERTGRIPEFEFIGQQATASIEVGFRLVEDAQYGFYHFNSTTGKYDRGLTVMLEKVMDVIYGLGVQTALTGNNSWLRAPQFELKGYIPDEGAGYIGYGFVVKLFTDMFDLGKLSA